MSYYAPIKEAAKATGLPERLISEWCRQINPMPHLEHGANKGHTLVNISRVLEYARSQEVGSFPHGFAPQTTETTPEGAASIN